MPSAQPNQWCCPSPFPTPSAARCARSAATSSSRPSVLCPEQLSIKLTRAVSVVKKILILTAGFGEGHNSAARGIRDALGQIAPGSAVECRDLFAEAFGRLNEIARRAYLVAINRAPRAWSAIYSWIDQHPDFRSGMRWFSRIRQRLSEIIERARPDVIVSVIHRIR